ncbi:MAG: hypothetical protein K9M57_08170 [Phycisphaerae bacterium]|nr:hypothetical protein [Phycisphaerae bacterium]
MVLLATISLAGCTVQVQDRSRPLVETNGVDSELELMMNQYTDKNKRGSESHTSETTIFQEELRLSTKGNVYHPNLMKFLGTVGLGLTQQRYDTMNQSFSSNGTLTHYGLNMNFLPLKPYPFGIGMTQTEDLVSRKFQSALRVKNTTTSFNTLLRVPDWPMSIDWVQHKISQNSDFTNSADRYTRDSDRFSYNLNHDFSDQSHLLFRFDWDKTSQSGANNLNDIDSKRFLLTHEQLFGTSDQHRLYSELTFLDKTQFTDTKSVDWSENLTIAHKDNFNTFYTMSYNGVKVGNIQNDSIGGTMGFNHQLYSSLTTSANVSGRRTKFGSAGQADQLGSRINLNYRKTNPLGVLTGLYSLSRHNDQNDNVAGIATVIDERHEFNDPFAIVLDKKNIEMNSIIVTDSSGMDVYTRNDDYTINQVGNQLELVMTPLGMELPNITDGQTILVSYTYQVAASEKTQTNRQEFRLAQNFENGLSIYYIQKRLDEELDSIFRNYDIPIDHITHSYGSTFRRGGLTLSAEYSDHQSELSPMESTDLNGSYSWRLSRYSSMSVDVSQSWVDVGGINPHDRSLFTTGGSFRSLITRRLRFNASSQWRDQQDSTAGPTEGIRFDSELIWKYRNVTAKTGWELNILDRNKQETTHTNLFLRVIREF